ncbi:NAD(P)H-binding protein [uncultured Tateyamaria sp.]|uniref:NAD(P)H-binding protein n=1 Tax=uncultured Tateyamaria sp. TaxID=455651 RepID=UPI00261DE003|nr:NAD(P)H-binding protein [uncultured Tateyamaria sp.]
MGHVIVLGAKGRFGRAAVAAFEAAGWNVTALARSWPAGAGPTRVLLDVTDVAALKQACAGQDVIVNAVHPPYHHWPTAVPRITAAVIAAAQSSGATVMIPGNIYNYGADLPPVLSETTPWVGNTGKGAIRIRMEQAYRDAGIRTIVLRSGDYFEGAKTGNWFEDHIAPKAAQGKLSYPGPRDLPHAWAYLPDMARALVGLAEQRERFDIFEEFGFEGYTLTGDELGALIGQIMDREMRFTRFPWWAVRTTALWSPLMREVLEMRYLWNRAHSMDGRKLRAALPGFVPTPVEVALRAATGADLPHREGIPTPA